MALTRHSVRTCFLWRDRQVFSRDTTGQRLWEALLSCLEVLQDPKSGSSKAGSEAVQESVKRFLAELLAQADDRSVAERLSASLRQGSAIRLLQAWRTVEAKGTVPWDAPRCLFTAPADQAFAAYSLGQLAFLFGHLRLAKDYTVEAFALLQEASGDLRKTDKPLTLRILEFLSVTLLLEVSFHSDGYDTFRDDKNTPQGLRIRLALIGDSQDYLQGFPALTDLGLAVRNGQASGGAKDFVEYFWSPFPNEKDRADLHLIPPKPPNPLAFAYVLSRKNRAGMLCFRYRDWKSAEEIFEEVRKEIDERSFDPVLVPLKHEAGLYLGRIKAQACDFGKAQQLIDQAQRYFESIEDEYARNKAVKARAELEYRKFHWPQAESMFQQVSEVSLEKGFAHDWATAEMHLAKMQSGFGFQAAAAERFARVNAHFIQYDVLHETIECLFWSTAADARHLDLSGHPRENVINARALMKLYKQLFEGSKGLNGEDKLLQSGGITRLLEALRDKRNPAVAEAMLDLRLGYLPQESLVQKLQRLARGERLERGGPRAKETRVTYQLLRLIRLQQAQKPLKVGRERQHEVVREYQEKRFQKLAIRDRVLSALEGTLRGRRGSDACFALQTAHHDAAELGLGGSLVPFLVELSQFFTERDCFIAMLLLLLDATDQVISLPSGVSKRGDRLKPDDLKGVYRSLTKYLVLERNFYLGPPLFAGRKNPALWSALHDKYGPLEWRIRYKRALLGGHGISYPDNAVGLGWVESLDTGGATLRITWVDDYVGDALRVEQFRRLQVPTEAVAQGHAEESLAPVVLVGRQGQGVDGHWPWTAHRIPLDLGSLRLFRGLEASPWYEPILEDWQHLLDRFTGRIPATCESPELTAADQDVIDERYADLARAWFGGRFLSADFERIFKADHGPSGVIPLYEEPPHKVRYLRTKFVLSHFPSRRPSSANWESLSGPPTATSAERLLTTAPAE